MAYREKILTLQEDKIFFSDNTGVKAVMMDWEAPIMAAHAQYVAENGGNILEIGYGLGISARSIQTYSPNSHTIVEIHPDIAKEAQIWANKQRGVSIVQGDWYGLTKEIQALGPFDGIFYDAYGDDNIQYLVEFCTSILNKGGRFTLWNPLPYPFGNEQKVRDGIVTYDVIDLSEVYKPANDYFNYNVYYLPKIQL